MVGYWLHEGVGKQEIGGVDGQTDVTGKHKRTSRQLIHRQYEQHSFDLPKQQDSS